MPKNGIRHHGEKPFFSEEYSLTEIIRRNRRLVRKIAGRYLSRCRTLTIEDLMQEGCIGLIKAAERFDPERGVQFSTYATWWIQSNITQAIIQQDRTIHIPREHFENMLKVYAIANKHGLDIHWDIERLIEICTGQNLSSEDVLVAIACRQLGVDCFYGISADGEEYLKHEPETNPFKDLEFLGGVKDMLNKMIEAEVITERDFGRIIGRYWEELEYQEIGDNEEAPVTKQAIQVAIKRALQKILAHLKERGIGENNF